MKLLLILFFNLVSFNMKISEIDESKWWGIINKNKIGTFFHTPDWYKVWALYADYGFTAYLIEFKSGRFALFPIGWKLRFKGIMKEYISGPVGTYGGPLSPNKLNEKEIKSLEKFIKSFNSISIRFAPFSRTLSSDFYTHTGFTQILDLRYDWKVILKKWSKGHLSAAKKGLKSGVIVKLANQQQWANYYQIYVDTFNRWNAKKEEQYSLALFESLKSINPDRCKLWLASINGGIIAGAICFYFNKHVIYWHGASFTKYLSLKPGQVLQYRIIEHAVKNNFDFYDFNPSGGHLGVEHFKKGFGGLKYSSSIYLKQPYLIQKLFELRRKLV